MCVFPFLAFFSWENKTPLSVSFIHQVSKYSTEQQNQRSTSSLASIPEQDDVMLNDQENQQQEDDNAKTLNELVKSFISSCCSFYNDLETKNERQQNEQQPAAVVDKQLLEKPQTKEAESQSRAVNDGECSNASMMDTDQTTEQITNDRTKDHDDDFAIETTTAATKRTESTMTAIPTTDTATALNWIVSHLDPLCIGNELYPSPTQQQICSIMSKLRSGESLVFAFRNRWYSLIDIYTKHEKDDIGKEQPQQYVWKNERGVEAADGLKGKIDAAVRRNPNLQSNVVLMGVKVHYVSKGINI